MATEIAMAISVTAVMLLAEALAITIVAYNIFHECNQFSNHGDWNTNWRKYLVLYQP